MLATAVDVSGTRVVLTSRRDAACSCLRASLNEVSETAGVALEPAHVRVETHATPTQGRKLPTQSPGAKGHFKLLYVFHMQPRRAAQPHDSRSAHPTRVARVADAAQEGASLLDPGEAVGLELALERAAVDAEGGGGARDVAADFVQDALDVCALDVGEVGAGIGRAGRW